MRLKGPPHSDCWFVMLRPERGCSPGSCCTAEGVYDLYVSLYFDVNGDGAISTADKALDLVLIEDAVTISAGIFSDGFESGNCGRWSGQIEERH